MADKPNEKPTWNPWSKPGSVTQPDQDQQNIPAPPTWPDQLVSPIPSNVDKLNETDQGYVTAQERNEEKNSNKEPEVLILEALERIEEKIDKIASRT
ncbi:MAG: hypothetical protein A3F33_01285 [Candidatus Woykebacteria bacterium RIFCSPHIGHO2_12_FULL_43_10]|nr:MAG: hypothetical protein A3F33_01285 [Candidatus Woykebacteria bacterium RIFCSPHIGHO2_12_FULL_43_10]